MPKHLVEGDGSYTHNPAYHGECFWLDTGEVLPCRFSSHRITVLTGTPQPRTLVVNQNFHADWRVQAGIVVAQEGLLAVQRTIKRMANSMKIDRAEATDSAR